MPQAFIKRIFGDTSEGTPGELPNHNGKKYQKEDLVEIFGK